MKKKTCQGNLHKEPALSGMTNLRGKAGVLAGKGTKGALGDGENVANPSQTERYLMRRMKHVVY
jgi:hypothetical protein